MREVMRYLASDGTEYDTIKAAEDHEDKCKQDFELDSKIKELQGVVEPYLDALGSTRDEYYCTEREVTEHNLDEVLQLIAEHLCK